MGEFSREFTTIMPERPPVPDAWERIRVFRDPVRARLVELGDAGDDKVLEAYGNRLRDILAEYSEIEALLESGETDPADFMLIDRCNELQRRFSSVDFMSRIRKAGQEYAEAA